VRHVLDGDGRTWLAVAAGLGCLAAVLALGVVVQHGATPIDQAAYRGPHGVLSPHRRIWSVVGAIAHERGHAHGSYLTAALPLLLAAILATDTLRRDRAGAGGPGCAGAHGHGLAGCRCWGARYRCWRRCAWSWTGRTRRSRLTPSRRWVLPVRRRPAGRPRPDRRRHRHRAAPAGLAPPLLAAGALALAVHATVRVAVGAHWLTDVLGSYLPAAGSGLPAAPLERR